MKWLWTAITAGLIILLFWLAGESIAGQPLHPASMAESHTASETQTPPGADSHGASSAHDDLGASLPLWSCIPFAGMLLSIALWPLIGPEFWHHHFSKIAAGWALILAIPLVAVYRGTGLYQIVHIMLADYLPFIILLWALYSVSGGILLRGTLQGTPLVNLIMLLIGTLLASWMGTTGAAMLMIRPFLRANRNRKNRTFMVVFFIFLVANIGGALTPLGDPPLFLGFLHGVSFFWTLHISPHMLTMVVLLLAIYFALDTFHYRSEKGHGADKSTTKAATGEPEKVPLKLEGKLNFLYLAGIVGAVLLSGIMDWGEVNVFGVHRGVQDWLRDLMLILIGILSILTTPAVIRHDNDFTWFPIKEVAYLFIGIFITMIPCLLILKAGSNGALAFIINGVNKPWQYFWVAGLLSSFLDNAPTYLTFFNTALGSFFAGLSEAQAVPLLMTEKAIYLKAISTGAVFFGACSYIGNAPNFMVRSISEEAGTPMPSFFGYIGRYTVVFLIPCFIIITFIFF